MTELTRRRMLSAAGVAGVAAIAGCSSSADEGDEDDEPEGKELGEISLENVDDEEHTIDVIVEFEREIEHWSTHELTAKSEENSGVTVERDWSTDPGEFRVTFRLDAGEPRQITPDYFNDPPSCLDLEGKVERTGALNVRGGPCGSGDTDLDGEE